MKKILFLLVIIIICTTNIISIADDIDEEQEETINKEEILSASTNAENIPIINSRSAIVIDRTSETVLYEKNAYDKRKMASTTKILTAIVVLENANLKDVVEVSKKAGGTGGSRLGLKEKDRITVNDLLYGLLLRSGNDSAVALAEHVGGSISGFSNLMNEKVKELGLKNSHFVTPHGLDEDEHYTTAYELALITDYALKNEKFANIVNTKDTTIYINGQAKNITNTNELLGNLNGVNGVKTGFTNGAGRCLVTSVTRNGHQIICVVLGADTKKYRTQDSIKLIEFAFKNYEYVNIKEKIEAEFKKWQNQEMKKIIYNKSINNYINYKLGEIKLNQIPILKNNIKDIELEINYKKELEAPVEENTPIGTICVKVKDKILVNVEILTSEKLEKKGILEYIQDFIKNYNYYISIGLQNII